MRCYFCHCELTLDTGFTIVSVDSTEISMCEDCRRELVGKISNSIDCKIVRRYGGFLLAHMQDNGCVPGWFSADLTPLPSLLWNADGGAHIWVLNELYFATKDEKYLTAAEKMARFLEREVMPRQRWADFEAFYSCSVKPETYFDSRTGQWPCNTMSMSWAMP